MRRRTRREGWNRDTSGVTDAAASPPQRGTCGGAEPPLVRRRERSVRPVDCWACPGHSPPPLRHCQHPGGRQRWQCLRGLATRLPPSVDRSHDVTIKKRRDSNRKPVRQALGKPDLSKPCEDPMRARNFARSPLPCRRLEVEERGTPKSRHPSRRLPRTMRSTRSRCR